MINSTIKYLLIFIILINPAFAQKKPPSIEEFHQNFENLVQKINHQTSGSKIDEFTSLKLVTYDRNSTLLTYHQTTHINKNIPLDVDNGNLHLVEKACRVYGPFMRHYKLKVKYNFENSETGKLIHSTTVLSKDCN